LNNIDDTKFMKEAVDLAKRAYERGFSPVGAVLTKDGQPIDATYSQRKIGNLMHAEYMLMSGNQVRGLAGMTLYTTLEPCLMCTGMAIVGKIDRVVYLLQDHWGSGPGNISHVTPYMQSRNTVFDAYQFDTVDDRNLHRVCLEMWKTYLTKQGHEWAIEGMLGITE
jgi:tRNA(adenine34) deaminase